MTTLFISTLIAGPVPDVHQVSGTPGQSSTGAVMLSENFDDPAAGALPASSADPNYEYAYDSGEYVVRRARPEGTGLATVVLPGTFADSSIAIDVRLVGEINQRLVGLECRRTGGADDRQYRFEVWPQRGAYRLLLFGGGARTELRPWTDAEVIRRGTDSNHLELSCIGSTIAVSVNGTPLTSVEDTTAQDGQMAFTVGSYDRQLVSEGRFDNLVVTQR